MDFFGSFQEKMAQPLSPWLLVDRAGKNVRLPATMIFLGREDCDITIQVSTRKPL